MIEFRIRVWLRGCAYTSRRLNAVNTAAAGGHVSPDLKPWTEIMCNRRTRKRSKTRTKAKGNTKIERR